MPHHVPACPHGAPVTKRTPSRPIRPHGCSNVPPCPIVPFSVQHVLTAHIPACFAVCTPVLQHALQCAPTHTSVCFVSCTCPLSLGAHMPPIQPAPQCPHTPHPRMPPGVVLTACEPPGGTCVFQAPPSPPEGRELGPEGGPGWSPEWLLPPTASALPCDLDPLIPNPLGPGPPRLLLLPSPLLQGSVLLGASWGAGRLRSRSPEPRAPGGCPRPMACQCLRPLPPALCSAVPWRPLAGCLPSCQVWSTGRWPARGAGAGGGGGGAAGPTVRGLPPPLHPPAACSPPSSPSSSAASPAPPPQPLLLPKILRVTHPRGGEACEPLRLSPSGNLSRRLSSPRSFQGEPVPQSKSLRESPAVGASVSEWESLSVSVGAPQCLSVFQHLGRNPSVSLSMSL